MPADRLVGVPERTAIQFYFLGLSQWRPSQYVTAAEAVRAAVQRGRPVGTAAWVAKAATRLGPEGTLRPRGRPRKPKAEK